MFTVISQSLVGYTFVRRSLRREVIGTISKEDDKREEGGRCQGERRTVMSWWKRYFTACRIKGRSCGRGILGSDINQCLQQAPGTWSPKMCYSSTLESILQVFLNDMNRERQRHTLLGNIWEWQLGVVCLMDLPRGSWVCWERMPLSLRHNPSVTTSTTMTGKLPDNYFYLFFCFFSICFPGHIFCLSRRWSLTGSIQILVL